jgi:alpha-glucosidase
MADFGYDVADYCGVDPRFGTLADFDDLLGRPMRTGSSFVLDFVPNHSSDQHAMVRREPFLAPQCETGLVSLA